MKDVTMTNTEGLNHFGTISIGMNKLVDYTTTVTNS